MKVHSDIIDRLRNGHVRTKNMHSQTHQTTNNIVIYHLISRAFGLWLTERYFCTSLEKWYGQNWTSWTASTALEYRYNFCLNYYSLGLLNALIWISMT